MTLDEILQDADVMAPNTLPVTTKIRWLNQIQRQIFRDYPVPEAVYPFYTEAETALYGLPDDMAEDRIQRVVVGENEYDYKSIQDEAVDNMWTITAGHMLLHPTPLQQELVYVYYKPRPVDMTAEDMDSEPGLPVDFHELLTYGVAARVARATGDVGLSVSHEETFYRLSEKSKLDLGKPRKRQVTINKLWR